MSRGGGHVVEVGLSIASVAYGALLGSFLLVPLRKSATEAGAMIGMIGGLGDAEHPALETTSLVPAPKVAFTWFVLIGSMLTLSLGWTMSQAPAQKILRRRWYFCSSCCWPAVKSAGRGVLANSIALSKRESRPKVSRGGGHRGTMGHIIVHKAYGPTCR